MAVKRLADGSASGLSEGFIAEVGAGGIPGLSSNAMFSVAVMPYPS